MGVVDAALIEWGAAARPRSGENESGDGLLVREIPNGALIAVVDGIGHGREAALAARTALGVVEAHALETPISVMSRCHRALRSTRGAVMSLAIFHARENSLTWLGVGNVAGFVGRARTPTAWETLFLRGGVLGQHVQPLAPSVVMMSAGDVLVIASDGVAWNPEDSPVPLESPDAMARRILGAHAVETDDALVLVARYRGRRSG
jgi:negative regulator of sigma-B (phosphoserine phosphatase)